MYFFPSVSYCSRSGVFFVIGQLGRRVFLKGKKRLHLCTFDAPVFQSLLSTFNCFVDTSFVISNNSKYKPFWEMFLFPHCLCKTNFWCILRPPQKEGKKRKSKKKKSACLIHFKVNYWIHVWLSSPRLKLVIIFNCISFLFFFLM